MPKLCDYLGPFEAMNSQQSHEFFAWHFGVENSFLCLCVLIGIVYIYMHHVWMMYWNRFFKVIRF